MLHYLTNGICSRNPYVIRSASVGLSAINSQMILPDELVLIDAKELAELSALN